jgi:5'-deoxynucleotidase
LLPKELQADFAVVMVEDEIPSEHKVLIKAADTISAYLKCQMELSAGNTEFSKAADAIKGRLEKIDLPEVNYFMVTFSPSYSLTLDELLN